MADLLNGMLETILVVDDHEAVLNSVVTVLENANFVVLSANSGANALKVAANTNGRIDLLLSDVDMPHMSGPDLGEALKKTRPNIHVMLMSGGASGNLLVLNYGWAFIQKPFLAEKLVQMVTDVLHSPDRSQLGGQEYTVGSNDWRRSCEGHWYFPNKILRRTEFSGQRKAFGNAGPIWTTELGPFIGTNCRQFGCLLIALCLNRRISDDQRRGDHE